APPDVNASPGDYEIIPSGGWARNYTLSYVPGTITIKAPYQLFITADNLSKVYGSSNPAFTATYSGLQDGDTAAVVSDVQFTTTANDRSAVGSYSVTPSGGTFPPYYTAQYAAGLLQVTPAPLTVTANNLIRRIGDPNPPFSVTYTGLMAWDDPGMLPCCTYNAPPDVNAPSGSYPINPFGGPAINYTITYVPGIFTIKTPYQLFITADNLSRMYGNNNPAFTATYSGLQDGDTAAVVSGIQFTTPANDASPVGSYPISPSGGIFPPYYAATYIPGRLQITQREVHLYAIDASAPYGTLPSLSYTTDGLLPGDRLSEEPTLTAGGGVVGTFPIYLTGGAAPNYNYLLIRHNGQLVVTAVPLWIRANDATMFDGDSTPPFTASFTGLQYNDSGNVVQGLNLVPDAANVVNNDDGSSQSAIIQSGALTAANYSPITFTPGTLMTVPKPPVTIIPDIVINPTGGVIHLPGEWIWTCPFGVPIEGADALRYVAWKLIQKLGLNVANVDIWMNDPANRAIMTAELFEFLRAPLISGTALYNQREIIKTALETQIREMKVKIAEEAVADFNAWKEERKAQLQAEGRLVALLGDVEVPDHDYEAEALATMITTGVSAATLAAVAASISITGSVMAGSILTGATWVLLPSGAWSLVSASTAAGTAGIIGESLSASLASTIAGPAAIIVMAVVVGACRISQVVERYNVEEKYANLVNDARNFDIDTLITGDSTDQTELFSLLMMTSMTDNMHQLVNL
ncbi:MAG: hypothetical protein JW943_02100, partial [Deltaproteobacteria bacterium]|nr:hypothetical protein [Deltaproteobacteria bacterium]